MEWYLNRSGRPEGPYEEAQIIQMVIEGFVPWNAMVGAQGGSAWIPIIEHPPFADALSRTSQAGLPADLHAKALDGRPPSDGSFPALDPATGSPYSAGMPISDVRFGLPKMSTGRLVGIGLGIAAVVGVASFAISRARGGFARTVDSVAADLVRYGVRGEPVDGAWPNVPPAGGEPNVHATNRAEVTTALLGLGSDPEPVLATLHFRLCGTSTSVELDAYVIDGDVRVSGVTAHPGDDCASIARDATGAAVPSAAESDNPRMKILGERGRAFWAELHDADCDLPLIRADDLERAGIAPVLAAEFTANDTEAGLRQACAAVAADAAESPFVALGTIGVVVRGLDDRLGVVSSRFVRGVPPTDVSTLSAIEARRIGH